MCNPLNENKLPRARLPKQVHTTQEERKTLLKFGKAIGRAIEELISIVSPNTFYRWVREETKVCRHDSMGMPRQVHHLWKATSRLPDLGIRQLLQRTSFALRAGTSTTCTQRRAGASADVGAQ